jgi:hypothetical protein
MSQTKSREIPQTRLEETVIKCLARDLTYADRTVEVHEIARPGQAGPFAAQRASPPGPVRGAGWVGSKPGSAAGRGSRDGAGRQRTTDGLCLCPDGGCAGIAGPAPGLGTAPARPTGQRAPVGAGS